MGWNCVVYVCLPSLVFRCTVCYLVVVFIGLWVVKLWFNDGFCLCWWVAFISLLTCILNCYQTSGYLVDWLVLNFIVTVALYWITLFVSLLMCFGFGLLLASFVLIKLLYWLIGL